VDRILALGRFRKQYARFCAGFLDRNAWVLADADPVKFPAGQGLSTRRYAAAAGDRIAQRPCWFAAWTGTHIKPEIVPSTSSVRRAGGEARSAFSFVSVSTQTTPLATPSRVSVDLGWNWGTNFGCWQHKVPKRIR
jgi:hypothetical protein